MTINTSTPLETPSQAMTHSDAAEALGDSQNTQPQMPAGLRGGAPASSRSIPEAIAMLITCVMLGGTIGLCAITAFNQFKSKPVANAPAIMSPETPQEQVTVGPLTPDPSVDVSKYTTSTN